MKIYWRNLLIIVVFLSIFLPRELKAQNSPDASAFIQAAGSSSDLIAAHQLAQENLAKEMSKWWLKKQHLYEKISFSNKDKHARLLNVWLEYERRFITAEEELGEICQVNMTIKEADAQLLFQEKYDQICSYIIKGDKALAMNKLGLFFRYYYQALIEYDLLAGKPLLVQDTQFHSDTIIDAISNVAEKFTVKIVGNEYNFRNRRLILQILYNRRPVNDLRMGILMGDEYKNFSVTNRYLQVDMYGPQYEDIANITFSVDLQDRSTLVWGKQVKELSFITGMNGFEAYRTIPLRKVSFEQKSWQDILVSAEDKDADLLSTASLGSVLQALSENISPDPEFFLSEEVFSDFEQLRQILNIRFTDLDTRLKPKHLADGIYWRNIDVIMDYQTGLQAVTNINVNLDKQGRIRQVNLGMKPLDYRLLTRKANSKEEQNLLHQTVALIEKQYTDALIGKAVYLDDYPAFPIDGWHWSEIEDIDIQLAENGVIYSYRLVLVDDQKSHFVEVNNIMGEIRKCPE